MVFSRPAAGRGLQILQLICMLSKVVDPFLFLERSPLCWRLTPAGAGSRLYPRATGLLAATNVHRRDLRRLVGLGRYAKGTNYPNAKLFW